MPLVPWVSLRKVARKPPKRNVEQVKGKNEVLPSAGSVLKIVIISFVSKKPKSFCERFFEWWSEDQQKEFYF